jgi:hypothetical protein
LAGLGQSKADLASAEVTAENAEAEFEPSVMESNAFFENEPFFN